MPAAAADSAPAPTPSAAGALSRGARGGRHALSDGLVRRAALIPDYREWRSRVQLDVEPTLRKHLLQLRFASTVDVDLSGDAVTRPQMVVVASALAPALMWEVFSCRVRRLNLSRRICDARSAYVLAEGLKLAAGLEKLTLAGCALFAEGAVSIMHALRTSTTLTSLSLSNTNVRARGGAPTAWLSATRARARTRTHAHTNTHTHTHTDVLLHRAHEQRQCCDSAAVPSGRCGAVRLDGAARLPVAAVRWRAPGRAGRLTPPHACPSG